MTVKNSFEFVRIILLLHLHETRRWKVIMEKFIPHPRHTESWPAERDNGEDG